jgi:hypothetical protein
MDEIPNISGFNYRIARHKVGDDAYYRIYECFYDENGKVFLWGESSPHARSPRSNRKPIRLLAIFVLITDYGLAVR